LTTESEAAVLDMDTHASDTDSEMLLLLLLFSPSRHAMLPDVITVQTLSHTERRGVNR